MAKHKPNETELPEHPEGWSKKGWDKYVKDHNRKLKRLHREYRGDNLESPPEGDYE